MKRRTEAGQVLVLAAVSLTTLLVAGGIGIDMGYLRYQRRNMQSAADSAAVAGAGELPYGDYSAAALSDAASNAFTDGSNGITVTVTNPPTNLPPGDPYQNNSNAVEVIVAQNQPTFFMKIFGVSGVPVSARAVAYLGNPKGCMYGLQPGNTSVNINFAGNLNAPKCGIIDNGNLSITGTGTVTAAYVGYSGTASISATVTPAPQQNIQGPDPLSYLTPPAASPCTYATTQVVNSPNPTVLLPGVYCGGIQIALTNTGTVSFNSGLYVLTGATGLQIAGSSTVTGSGVTFYNTGSGAIDFTGGNITLSAPSAPIGSLPAAILFYQDPSDASAADVSEAGSGNVTLVGTLYFPSAALTISGSNSTATNTLIVAGSVSIVGGNNFNADYSTIPGGSPIKDAGLVE